MNNPFKTILKRVIYKNPWMTLHEHEVIRPDGRSGIQAFIETSGGGSVLPIMEDGSVFLSREYKYPVSKYSIEVFSGGRKAGEEPIEAVKRELKEELGAIAEEWEYIGFIHPFTSFSKSPNHLFIAKKLNFSHRMLDDGELIDVIRVDLSKALKLVLNGEITHAASCVLILRAARDQHI